MNLNQLKKRWQACTGFAMPDAIANLPLDKIRRAVELTEAGATVVVPRERPAESVTPDSDESSLQEWDRHKEF